MLLITQTKQHHIKGLRFVNTRKEKSS